MSNDHVADALSWFEDGWNQRNEEIFDSIADDTVIGHAPAGDLDINAFKTFYRAFIEMMPDLHVTVQSAATMDDVVAVRWRVEGTHTGEIEDCEPTGKAIDFSGSTWFRYEGERLAEAWDHWDATSVFGELGWDPQLT